MYYIVHYKLHAPISTRGQTPCPPSILGWNDPVGHVGHAVVAKSGVVPAQFGVLSASKILRRAPRNL